MVFPLESEYPRTGALKNRQKVLAVLWILRNGTKCYGLFISTMSERGLTDIGRRVHLENKRMEKTEGHTDTANLRIVSHRCGPWPSPLAGEGRDIITGPKS